MENVVSPSTHQSQLQVVVCRQRAVLGVSYGSCAVDVSAQFKFLTQNLRALTSLLFHIRKERDVARDLNFIISHFSLFTLLTSLLSNVATTPSLFSGNGQDQPLG